MQSESAFTLSGLSTIQFAAIYAGELPASELVEVSR